MSQLVHLRRRIKSIKTTKKITYAMRLISMSLYGKLEKRSASLTYYQDTIRALYLKLIGQNQEWQNQTLFSQDPLASTPLVILVASSKGLCGSFNSNLFKYFNHAYYAQEHQNPAFITVGTKATQFITHEKAHSTENKIGPLIAHYDDLSSNNYLDIARLIVDHIVMREGRYASVTTYSNHFKNFFIQKPEKHLIAPLDFDSTQSKKNSANKSSLGTLDNELFDTDNIIFEQDILETMNQLFVQYLHASIQHILFQSLIAEQAGRFIAMDNATTNANKILDKVTLQYNKARQAAITRELTELSASFASYQ
jgi:F-type H+-transporting ATPase subunit gamma